MMEDGWQAIDMWEELIGNDGIDFFRVGLLAAGRNWVVSSVGPLFWSEFLGDTGNQYLAADTIFLRISSGSYRNSN